jgi:NADPH-dependent curcumin reductase CurA
MSQPRNRMITLASRPSKGATMAHFDPDDFAIVEAHLPQPRDGEILVRNLMFSVDPFQRTLMGNTSSETAVLSIGDVMRGATVGIVEESRSPSFGEGDFVAGWSGWQERAVSDGTGLRRLDPSTAPVSTVLGVLGHTGLTAWLGSSKLVDPKPGGTFVVINAAGSVGSLAVQIAKLKGHRVVGIAGGDEKAAFLQDVLGVDAAIDYRSETFERRSARLPSQRDGSPSGPRRGSDVRSADALLREGRRGDHPRPDGAIQRRTRHEG